MNKFASVASCMPVALTALTTVGQNVDVTWTGAVDANWNVPDNWSTGRVPGTKAGDRVLLSGQPTTPPVVATLVDSDKPISLQVSDDALLEVTHSGLQCDQVVLGATDGAGGGHLLLRGRGEGVMTVAGDLRIGHSTAATSGSSVKLRTGKLNVGGELFIGNGLVDFYGNAPAIAEKDLTVSENGTLRFDFNTMPIGTIEVSNQLTIAKGAKLELDLRGYTMGGNELELIRFGSASGEFDPANVSIKGLGGGVVTMDEDSLNLTVIDDVAKRSSSLWFVTTGGDGTDVADLQINTGRRIRNLSSPDLSYSVAAGGDDSDDKIYSVSWSGSDFDGDGTNDSVTFDLRVEGFVDSPYRYDAETESSLMTAIGKEATVSGSRSGWGVGADMDLDAGETLRFTVENLKMSTPGEGKAGHFVGMQMAESLLGRVSIKVAQAEK